MKNKLSGATVFFILTFSSFAIAQVSPPADSLSRLDIPTLPPIEQMSTKAMVGGVQAATAPPAETESVTVTATKLREEFHKFIRSFVAPTQRNGKIPRWQRRICPLVVGQDPHFNAFIAQRIKYVALAAGAHVNTEASCKPNIEVIFTTTPQALMDNVRQHDVFWLGYAETVAQLDELTAVTRSVQAWYTTETGDANGVHHMDTNIIANVGGSARMFEPPTYVSPGAGRINDNIISGFNHVLIVVDTTKLAGQKIVPLADYISMLSLTQIKAPDTCQQLSSIANLLVADCDKPADGLTPFDLAYLQGLYKMTAERRVLFQRNDIASVMADALMPEN